MKKTLLVIARHGNTFSKGDVVTRVGTTDLPLVESGLEQGRRIGQYLRTHKLLPDRIFTSSLRRTIQTAAEAQREAGIDVPVSALTIFNEIDYGVDENQPEAQVAARIGEEALQQWEQQAMPPAGWHADTRAIIASWHEFAAFLRKEHAGQTVMVVTSNGIARFAPYLTGDFEAFRQHYPIKISTGALCLLEHDGIAEAWQCKGWNIQCDRG